MFWDAFALTSRGLHSRSSSSSHFPNAPPNRAPSSSIFQSSFCLHSCPPSTSPFPCTSQPLQSFTALPFLILDHKASSLQETLRSLTIIHFLIISSCYLHHLQKPKPLPRFLMGYFSCKAQSAISVSDSYTHPTSHRPTIAPRENQQEQYQSQKVPHEKSIKIQRFDYSDLEAATDNFSDRKLLGRGSHGLVYKAVLRSGRLVAVKKPSRRLSSPRSSSADDPQTEFDNELHILSHLHSHRFVNLVGYAAGQSNDTLLVVEFMSNGTLYDVLHCNSKPPNWGRRIRLVMQTAKAIETLHAQSPPVIHRDVKSSNVLIDRNYNARLGDFGLSLRCHTDDYRLRSTRPAGTIGYLDPCYVTPDNLSTKNDVFSFGILLLEIISGRKAIDISYSPPSIVDWAIPLIRKGKHLAIFDPRIPPLNDPFVRKQLAVVAAKCVRSCKERRPTMKQIVQALEGLSKLLPLHSWNGIVNPCMMVETVGHPVEPGKPQTTPSSKRFQCGHVDDVDGKYANLSRNSRRIYSDLGLRSNLMDLMAEPGGGYEVLENNGDGARSKSATLSSSFRVTGRRHIRSHTTEFLTCRMRRNDQLADVEHGEKSHET